MNRSQTDGLLPPGLIGIGIDGALFIGGLGVGGAVLTGVGVAVRRCDVENILRRVKFHLGHLTVGHHVLEFTVLHRNGRGLISSAGHIRAGIADEDRQQQCPAYQRDDAAYIAVFPAAGTVGGIFFVVLIHVLENSFQGKPVIKVLAVYHTGSGTSRIRVVFFVKFL